MVAPVVNDLLATKRRSYRHRGGYSGLLKEAVDKFLRVGARTIGRSLDAGVINARRLYLIGGF
jgi:hypothetical protein